ncbi:unnamed protein product [Caenorhabditis sp. 36 PRJEB53466]|nr:unnamed protein product [Caenorhabditis sp. 36 PRJEB53466]
MKLLLILICVFIVHMNAQFENIDPCNICNDSWFLMPTTWEKLTRYLRFGCNRLDKSVIQPCRDVVDSMNLHSQYPTLLPKITEFYTQMCKKYCGGVKG